MCCVTLTRATFNHLFQLPQATFVIPIFRAPNTTTTTTTTATTSASRIFSALVKQEEVTTEKSTLLSTSSTPMNLINQHIFENLILTNTIVAAFCIVLMITLTAFLLFLLLPSIRRRWLKREESKIVPVTDDSSQLSQQLCSSSSLHHFTLGPSRLNPLFEPPPGTTTTAQFGTLFQPHTTATTLLHPTFWTPMSPASVVSTPVPSQQQQSVASTPPATSMRKPINASTVSATKPPVPTHPPTSIPKSPRKR